MILFTDMYAKLTFKEMVQGRELHIDLPKVVLEDENSGRPAKLYFDELEVCTYNSCVYMCMLPCLF